MPDILKVEGLTKHFRDFSLENISFNLEPGYIMGLVGPNGSGKTTTIKLIMNMLGMDGGQVSISGFDSVKQEVSAKEAIGYVPDESMFLDEWKIKDVKGVLTSYYKTFDADKFDGYMKSFELPAGRKIKDYSKGMKTKLMLAAVLSRETKLLLLDEPTSGLDPVIRTQLLDMLQEYIADGRRSVLFSTHITTDLEKIADYITFISRGKLVFSGPKDDSMGQYRVIKAGSESFDEVKNLLIGSRRNKFGFEGLIKTEDEQELPEGIESEPANLEEIIVYNTLGVKE